MCPAGRPGGGCGMMGGGVSPLRKGMRRKRRPARGWVRPVGALSRWEFVSVDAVRHAETA